MPGSRILLVEDSDAIRVPLTGTLRHQGYQVASVTDGARLEELLGSFRPELVILDVMLPGRDGFKLLEVIRSRSTSGVLLLTARDTTDDRVRGLTSGADDYLVKPFELAELLARTQAVLRRTGAGGVTTAVGDLTVGDGGADVVRAGRRLDLTSTERAILAYLAARPGQVVSKLQLLTNVWGYDGFDENVVEVHVSALRRKLEQDGGARLVHTVRGRGYRLAEQP